MNAEIPILEEVCPSCKGEKGRYYADAARDDGWSDCPRCKGSGFVPTDAGKRILSLIQHNSKLSINAQLCLGGA